MLLPMDAPSIEFTSMPGLEICRVSHSSHVFPRHFHDDIYSVGLMHRGACRCLGPGRDDATVSQGQACLINPGQVHAGGPVQNDGFSYTMFYVSQSLIQSLAEDLSRSPLGAPEFTVLVSNRQDVCESLRHLALCLGKGNDLEAESALVRTLGNVLRAHGGVSLDACGHDRTFVRQAKEMLAADLSCKITIRDMASGLGISQYHFLRVFKRQTGLPPHVFRTQRRVELARKLVRRGTPLSEVAQLAGFSDQPHFTNTFKLYTGVTPGKYAAHAMRSPSTFRFKEICREI